MQLHLTQLIQFATNVNVWQINEHSILLIKLTVYRSMQLKSHPTNFTICFHGHVPHFIDSNTDWTNWLMFYIRMYKQIGWD